MQGIRVTLPTALVLSAFLEGPAEGLYGLQVIRATGMKSGAIYPILRRLEDRGWLTSEWERGFDPRSGGRPARRYYRLTPGGAERARPLLLAIPALRG